MKYINNTTKQNGKYTAEQHIVWLDFYQNINGDSSECAYEFLMRAAQDYDVILDKDTVVLCDKE